MGEMAAYRKSILAIHTATHFWVDFSCFYALYHGLAAAAGPMAATVGLLAYNIIAFGLQPVFGYYMDKNKDFPGGAAGCLMLAAGVGFCTMGKGVPSLVLCGLGNALFHVGGAIDTLKNAGGKMRDSGIYVSSGALGVSLGTFAGVRGILPPLSVAFLMVICLMLQLWVLRRKSAVEAAAYYGENTMAMTPAVVIALCMAAVVIRAFAGMEMPMAWRQPAGLLVFLPSVGACLGKAAGGFLADWQGGGKTGAASLILSIPFIWLGRTNPAIGFMGILLFNITMPITLCILVSQLNYFPGLAFGLTAFGLLLGTVPTFFWYLPEGVVLPVVTALILIAAACVALAAGRKTFKAYGRKIYEKI